MLDSTKLKKTFSLRRRSQQCEAEVPDKLFKTVDRHYKTQLNLLRERFEKVSVYTRHVFEALAKYDARFQFESLSLDDCRCEIVSENEVKMICELGKLPESCYEIQCLQRGVKVQLNEAYLSCNDNISWSDIFGASRTAQSERRLNTRSILDALTTCLGRAVSQVWNEHRNVGLVYRVSGNLTSIYVDLPDQGSFSVTLLPAIRLDKSRVARFGPRMEEFCQPFCFDKQVFSEIYVIAQPNENYSDELWQLIFNDVETRLVNSEKFACGKQCLYALGHLMNFIVPSSPRDCPVKLSACQLQVVIIKEYSILPNSKAWTPAKFQKRLLSILTSLKSYLKDGVCKNPFTLKNIFANFDEKSLKLLTKDVEHVIKTHESVLRNW